MSFTRPGSGHPRREDHHIERNRTSGERLNPTFALQRHTAPTAGVMILGVIAYNTRSLLVLIRCTTTAHRYVHDILEPHVLPLMQRLPGSTFKLDNAHPPAQRVSQDCLRTVITLPLDCPDPIETSGIQSSISGIPLGLRVGHPTSLNELEAMLQQIWNDMSQDIIQSLHALMSDRVASCIRARGGSTGCLLKSLNALSFLKTLLFTNIKLICLTSYKNPDWCIVASDLQFSLNQHQLSCIRIVAVSSFAVEYDIPHLQKEEMVTEFWESNNSDYPKVKDNSIDRKSTEVFSRSSSALERFDDSPWMKKYQVHWNQLQDSQSPFNRLMNLFLGISSDKVLKLSNYNTKVDDDNKSKKMSKTDNSIMIPQLRYGASDYFIPARRLDSSNYSILNSRFKRIDSSIPGARFERSNYLILNPSIWMSDTLISMP
ncbi:transposable element Tcb1 transposase [Trichonephila clavipes]|nr:transposable element Tcb1 transposase [Trichonephila clavipes]